MKLAIADERISAGCERGLLRLGFRVIKLPPLPNLPAAMASHPDMLMLAYKNEIVTSCLYAESADYILSDITLALDGVRLNVCSDSQGDSYPYDCIYNALVIGDKLFTKTDTAASGVISLAKRHGLNIVHTNQGYPACTTLPLGNSFAITSDKGMERALQNEGIRVTLIENGDISLPPYDYGFIGGAAGTLGDTVYFLGNPEHHRAFEKIQEAIASAGMKYTALSDEPLADLGRLILYDSEVD